MWVIPLLFLVAVMSIVPARAQIAQTSSNRCPITILAGASFSGLVHRYVVGFHIDGASGYSAGKSEEFDSSGGVLSDYVDCDKVTTSTFVGFIIVDFTPASGRQPRQVNQTLASPKFPVVMYYKPLQIGKAINVFVPARRRCRQRSTSAADYLTFEVRHSSDPTKMGGTTSVAPNQLKPDTLQSLHLYYAFDDNEEAVGYKLVVFGRIGGCRVSKWEGAINTIYDGSLLSFQFDELTSQYHPSFD